MDFDGVLWSNGMYDRFDGIEASVEKLCELGKQIYFVGNNTTHNKMITMEKCNNFACFEPRSGELLDVKETLITNLRDIAHASGKVYIVGSQLLADDLEYFDGSILDKPVCFTETDHSCHPVKVLQHETITYIVNLEWYFNCITAYFLMRAVLNIGSKSRVTEALLIPLLILATLHNYYCVIYSISLHLYGTQ